MILSASRRTDIPAFFSDWFYQRLREGYVYVRNPMRHHQVARISLAPEVLDGIVFWTKNPAPMLSRLGELAEHPFYFQYTLTSYGRDIEPNVPAKGKEGILTFQRLSGLIGSHRVNWRYDPILLNGTYTISHHLKYFEQMAKQLQGHTRRCVIGFIEPYKNTKRHAAALDLHPIEEKDMRLLAKAFGEIGASYGLSVSACCEPLDFSAYGIERACCIDGTQLEAIAGYALQKKKDKGQRVACACMESIDIGAYNTCANGCAYCYANYKEHEVRQNHASHNPLSPLLTGELGENDTVYDRTVRSLVATHRQMPGI